MREILFRGKHLGEWASGDVLHGYYDAGDTCISKITSSAIVPVLSYTVGEYTGQTDQNGTKIFEDDIAKYDDEMVVIEWDEDDAMFYIRSLDGTNWTANFSQISGTDLEVIGNIHDNPELLKEGAP